MASVDDPEAVEAGLADCPCLVVAERTTPAWTARIAQACPDALMVDVSRVVGRGYPAPGDLVGVEAILDALGIARERLTPA